MKKKSFPIFTLLYKNIVLIIICVILGGIVFGAYSLYGKKPSYSAAKEVVVSGSIDSSSMKSVSDATNSATLAELLLPTVSKIMKTQETMTILNRLYKKNEPEGKNIYINNSSIGFSYTDDSLIVQISYVDSSAKAAIDKLEFIVDSFDDLLKEYDKMDTKLFSTGDISIRSIQEGCSVSETRPLARDIIIGLIIGLAISIAYVIIRYLFDNKVKTEEEVFELTGEKVIAYLEK